MSRPSRMRIKNPINSLVGGGKAVDKLTFRVKHGQADNLIKGAMHGISPSEIGRLTDARATEMMEICREVEWQLKLAKELEKKLGKMFGDTATIEEIRAALYKIAFEAIERGDKAMSDVAINFAKYETALNVLKHKQGNEIDVIQKAGDYSKALSDTKKNVDLDVMGYLHNKAVQSMRMSGQGRKDHYDDVQAAKFARDQEIKSRMEAIRSRDYTPGIPASGNRSASVTFKGRRHRSLPSGGNPVGNAIRGARNVLGGLFR